MTLAAELMRSQRARLRLKQSQIAALVGCSSSLITKLENEKSEIPLHLVLPLQKALRIDPEQWRIALVGDFNHDVKKALNLLPKEEDALSNDSQSVENGLSDLHRHENSDGRTNRLGLLS